MEEDEGAPPGGGGVPGRSGSPGWDPASLREEEFEQHAVYLVPDQTADPVGSAEDGDGDGDHHPVVPRAEASLPRNLVLKPSQALSDVSHF